MRPACDPWDVASPGGFLNDVVPPLVRLAERPGAALVRVASLGVGVFALLGLVYVVSHDGGTAWIPVGVAAVLAVPVALLAVRRWRLNVFTQGLGSNHEVSVLPGEIALRDGVRSEPSVNQAAFEAAIAENRIRSARFLPRVEAAQRAAVAAAGGTVHAPYLKDDLRWTIAALVGTLAAIPLSTLGSIVTAILLLS